jgi:MYXO-CTERM domain-containing protein
MVRRPIDNWQPMSSERTNERMKSGSRRQHLANVGHQSSATTATTTAIAAAAAAAAAATRRRSVEIDLRRR